jgi:hypothetical protein
MVELIGAQAAGGAPRHPFGIRMDVVRAGGRLTSSKTHGDSYRPWRRAQARPRRRDMAAPRF